ncbi:bifunctional sugar-1-phosphate nucleotidylyltransferase/acetyltransferase [Chloroflexota bacterium]
MKAIILAAGEGKRMSPLSQTRPKVMLPLANRPILEHLIVEIREAGINELVIIVGYHEEQIRDYFGNGRKWGVAITYLSQRKQLGTGDAVKQAENYVDGNFLVLNGDAMLVAKDISAIINAKRITIGTSVIQDTRELGVLELERNKVVRIHEKIEKPPSNTANTGIYLFTPEIFNTISRTNKSPRGEYEITDAIQMLVDEGVDIFTKEISHWLDISHPWDMLAANKYILNSVEPYNFGEIEDNVCLKGLVSVGKNTIVRSGSYIVGPVIIGQNCDIGPNCYIRPYTSIGDDCHVGNAVEVKNSIIMNATKVPHHNYIGDSVVGVACNFGAGTKIANLRLDKKDIVIAGIDTKRRKLGAILGDRVETGINSCINVGSIIGNNTYIGPGAIVSGIILPDSRIS